jgi:hypothetical protein
LTAHDPGDISAVMEALVECTHCGVLMTSWSAPGSPIRYYQCPICRGTQSSAYGEVFRRGAGARLKQHKPSPGGIPMASSEDIQWAGIKARAARWFARLDAEERRSEPSAPIPVVDPRHVVEIAPARRAGRRKQ